jgi:hypothetical protein
VISSRGSKRMGDGVRLNERCAILAQTVRALKPIYESSNTTQNQKQLLETIIGAIWYLPQPPNLWTGKISLEGAKALRAGHRVTRDHQYPRKLAARELLGLNEIDLTGSSVHALYLEKFGRFNLITKQENRKLMRFQRAGVFVNSEDCYARAGVQLIDEHELVLAVQAVRKIPIN